jgi:hypothetical protein
MKIGYACVSTMDQNPALQLETFKGVEVWKLDWL